jgi:hypothetical protein
MAKYLLAHKHPLCLSAQKNALRYERLSPYMGGIAKQNGIFPKCIVGNLDEKYLWD